MIEIERQYYDFVESAVKSKLNEIGAEYQGKYLFKQRMYFPVATSEFNFVRIRNTGSEVTITTKSNSDTEFELESERIVDSFESAVAECEARDDIKFAYYLEKIREIYELPDAEIVFDSYPGLEPFIEIEACSVSRLEELESIFGFTGKGGHRGVSNLYKSKYGITANRKKDALTFGNALGKMGPFIRYNRRLFETTLSDQLTFANNIV
jgi:adenylate cyclase class IV